MTVAETFSVASVNVNGIRAAYRKGMAEWVEEAAPDLLLLQEVRADSEIAEGLLGPDYTAFSEPSLLKGRAGVTVALRKSSPALAVDETEPVVRGLAKDEEPVDSGRWIEVPLRTSSGLTLRVVSAYFHAGQAGHPRQEAKLRHLQKIDQRMGELLNEGAHTLVSGDFNIVRSPLDIKNWKTNHNRTSGVLDEEMEYLNRWVEGGWDDVVRTLAGQEQGPYSWWSMRGKAFDNNAGWRIDYHYATPDLGSQVSQYQVGRAASWDTRFSDHAPVVIDVSL